MNGLLRLSLPLLIVLLVSVPTSAVPVRQQPKKKENSNALIKKHKDKITMNASTTYGGYPATNLIDGNPESSWYSASNDSVGKGTAPWVEVQLPEDESVSRVNIQGNRDPSYPTGYSVLEGKLELMDKDQKVIWSGEAKATGDQFDFEFDPGKDVKGVRYIRFHSTKDQGADNGSGDIALGEILAE